MTDDQQKSPSSATPVGTACVVDEGAHRGMKRPGPEGGPCPLTHRTTSRCLLLCLSMNASRNLVAFLRVLCDACWNAASIVVCVLNDH